MQDFVHQQQLELQCGFNQVHVVLLMLLPRRRQGRSEPAEPRTRHRGIARTSKRVLAMPGSLEASQAELRTFMSAPNVPKLQSLNNLNYEMKYL